MTTPSISEAVALEPRPISEAPKDGRTLLDTAGRRFHWGSIRGEYGFKWKDRSDEEYPWATTVGYFYDFTALTKPSALTDLKPLADGSNVNPIYRHKKTGGLYEKLMPMGRIQSSSLLHDMDEVAIYRSKKDGSLWARKASEFDDGRFELLSAAPVQPAPVEILRCHGCGRPYEKGPDLVVSDADWARIKPPEGESQVMCPNCMNDAFEAIGAPDGSVEAAFTSGPFAQSNWKKPAPTPSPADDVERVARAIYVTKGYCYTDDERMFQRIPWEDADDITQEGCRTEARAALAAMRPAQEQVKPFTKKEALAAKGRTTFK